MRARCLVPAFVLQKGGRVASNPRLVGRRRPHRGVARGGPETRERPATPPLGALGGPKGHRERCATDGALLASWRAHT